MKTGFCILGLLPEEPAVILSPSCFGFQEAPMEVNLILKTSLSALVLVQLRAQPHALGTFF